MRPIRSYVLRQGRTTPAQKRALDELLPRYGIPFSTRKLPKNLVLEIGSGMGETTAAIAKAHPELEFVAVEVHGPGVGSVLNRVAAENLSNVKVIRHDALAVLEQMVEDGSLAGIHLFFPDPWPKKRHHKRRLVQPGFAALAHHVAFYPSRMDACWLAGEQVQAQEGDFYGGWRTSAVVGPFKGGPGTWGW